MKSPSKEEIQRGNALLMDWLMPSYPTYQVFDGTNWVDMGSKCWVRGKPTKKEIRSVMVNGENYDSSQVFFTVPNFHNSIKWCWEVRKKITDSGYTMYIMLKNGQSRFNIIEDVSMSSTRAIGVHKDPLTALWRALVKFVELQNQKS